ncbi:NfeD family protein [Entomospira entomophila]|uniref:NfeD family protein n=1 Tax=Entomospira entomophila TaxID=2719988 RepID=A0A968G8K1_9SPIO|nr:NfeD family protein [Entomospira entomophilus]NIZ39966.1 NfeD family protein [Entomospira entomophilus]WDI35527.1 NfeD family protein [Entomospira entomophilus]
MYTKFWLVAFIIFLIAEFASIQLIAIWFALAAVATFFLSFFIGSFSIQVLIFVILSGVFLIALYPIFKNFYKPKADTNGELMINKDALVIERIDRKTNKGQVKIDGKEWSIKLTGDAPEIIEVGELVTVRAIEGVKLVVEYKKTGDS